MLEVFSLFFSFLFLLGIKKLVNFSRLTCLVLSACLVLLDAYTRGKKIQDLTTSSIE
jgi:hypothetical protein